MKNVEEDELLSPGAARGIEEGEVVKGKREGIEKVKLPYVLLG